MTERDFYKISVDHLQRSCMPVSFSPSVIGTISQMVLFFFRGTDDPNLIKDRYNDIKTNPVVPMSKVRFHGVVTRAQLVTLLKNQVWYDPEAGVSTGRLIKY